GTATSVNYASASGTATSGTDFTATSGTLTFLGSETSKTITVATLSDAATESAETVLMNLSSPNSGATITTSQGTGTINDNVTPGSSFAIGNATAVTEGGTLTFTVTRTGSAFSVDYATASGTATSGSDFTATSGTLYFIGSSTSETITVATIDDSTHESAETVLVNLSGANGGGITVSQGSGTINDNDP
ncbi:MAG: Calx-beta domain-containing protein, partial [Sphingobium sp.]